MRRGYGVEAGKLISYYGVDVLGVRRIGPSLRVQRAEHERASAQRLQAGGRARQAGFDGTPVLGRGRLRILKNEIEAVRKEGQGHLPLDEPEWM